MADARILFFRLDLLYPMLRFATALFALLIVSLASAGQLPAHTEKEASVSGNFFRLATLPKWSVPLESLPPTDRSDPAVLRLSEAQAWVGATPAVLFNRALQVNDQSELSAIGQFSINYYPFYQKLYLHRVVILRAGVALDRTFTVNTRLLQREKNMENGMYDGATTLQLLLDDVRVGDTLWITYTVEGDNPVFGNRWAADFVWDSEIPIERRVLTVLHPRARTLYWRQLGDYRTASLTPYISQSGPIERLRFEGRAIEALESEPSVPSDYLAPRILQF